MTNFTFGSLWSAVVTVLKTSVASNVYYVTTNSSDDSGSIDINTLKHYLVNSKKYLAFDSQLIFLSGEYQLDADLVFENI